MTWVAAVKADNPFAWWRLGEPAGSEEAADFSGNGLTGAYMNTVELGIKGPLIGDADTSAAFNTGGTGEHDHVKVPDNALLHFGKVLTVEAFFRQDSPGRTDCILDKGVGGPIIRRDGENHYLARIDSTGTCARTVSAITDSAWHHLVVEYLENGEALIWLDAVLDCVQVGKFNIASTLDPLTIGISGGGTEDSWVGGLDEVILYDHGLGKARIEAHLAAARPLPEAVVLPSITGKPHPGNELKADRGEWSGAPTTYRYAWQMQTAAGGWTTIPKANGLAYVVRPEDADRKLRFEVTAENAQGKAHAQAPSVDVPRERLLSGGVLTPLRRLVRLGGLAVPEPAKIFRGLALEDYFRQSAPEAVSLAPDPAGAARLVLKMVVDNADVAPVTPTADPRAQLAPYAELDFEHSKIIYLFQPGAELWIRFGFFLPEDLPTPPSWFQLVQLFGPPFEGVAPWALKLSGPELRFQRNATYGFDIPWGIAEIPRGRWTRGLLHVLLAEEGWLELWLNGARITFFDPPTSYNPHGEPPQNRLAMQTIDASNNGDEGNTIFLQNYREAGSIPGKVTIYHEPLLIKAA